MQPASEAQAHVADYETPEPSGKAPAEFALFDAFAEDHEPAPAEVQADAANELAEPTEPDLPSLLQVELPHVEASQETATPAAEAASPQPEPSPARENANQDPPASERRHPLRFTWQADRASRFSIDSDEFLKLIGPLTASLVGRTWREIAGMLGLDPDARMQNALAARDTFGGVTLNWPVDGGYLPIELSGVPTLDGEQHFAGYRGFGVCRDMAGLARLDVLRRHGISISPPNPQPPWPGSVDGGAAAEFGGA